MASEASAAVPGGFAAPVVCGAAFGVAGAEGSLPPALTGRVRTGGAGNAVTSVGSTSGALPCPLLAGPRPAIMASTGMCRCIPLAGVAPAAAMSACAAPDGVAAALAGPGGVPSAHLTRRAYLRHRDGRCRLGCQVRRRHNDPRCKEQCACRVLRRQLPRVPWDEPLYVGIKRSRHAWRRHGDGGCIRGCIIRAASRCPAVRHG